MTKEKFDEMAIVNSRIMGVKSLKYDLQNAYNIRICKSDKTNDVISPAIEVTAFQDINNTKYGAPSELEVIATEFRDKIMELLNKRIEELEKEFEAL